ncbi:camp-dependent protein kinase catalytic subunit, partial [Mortierella sp. NVP41]
QQPAQVQLTDYNAYYNGHGYSHDDNLKSASAPVQSNPPSSTSFPAITLQQTQPIVPLQSGVASDLQQNQPQPQQQQQQQQQGGASADSMQSVEMVSADPNMSDRQQLDQRQQLIDQKQQQQQQQQQAQLQGQQQYQSQDQQQLQLQQQQQAQQAQRLAQLAQQQQQQQQQGAQVQQQAVAGAGSVPSSQQQQQQRPQQQQAAARRKFNLDDFRIHRTLGTGSFGRVHLVQSRFNSRFYAMKVLKKTEVVRLKQVEHTNNEKMILERVEHPFLINLWGTFQDVRNLYMVMDYVVGGELFSVLRKSQ